MLFESNDKKEIIPLVSLRGQGRDGPEIFERDIAPLDVRGLTLAGAVACYLIGAVSGGVVVWLCG